MTPRKPRKRTDPRTVTPSVSIATATAVPRPGCVAPSPVSPAMLVATGASSRPMTATIAPMAAGGKTTSSQRVPATRTTCETRTKKSPKAMKPPCAAA